MKQIIERGEMIAYPAVIQIIGYKNSGKTTLVCNLVKTLKQHGLTVGTIKHDVHDFDIDQPGKDSWRHREAGAEIAAVTSAKKTAIIEERNITLNELLNRMVQVDVVLVEGFKLEPHPKVVIVKNPEDESLLDTTANILMVAAWDSFFHADVPVFHINETEDITNFLYEYINLNQTTLL